MVKAEFTYKVNKDLELNIIAKCKSVDDYGAKDLRLYITDADTGERYDVPSRILHDEIEALAVEILLEETLTLY